MIWSFAKYPQGKQYSCTKRVSLFFLVNSFTIIDFPKCYKSTDNDEIYVRSPSPGNNALFSKGKVNVETWRCTSTLRGHNGDVLDVAWSPQDIWLASASVDNTIIIWDTAKLPGT